MDIVIELKDAYSFLGDPLHRKAYDEIERLRKELQGQALVETLLMDIVVTLRDRYRLDPTVQAAADEIERLRKYVKLLGEEVYLLNKDQPSGDKPDENS
jgi:hypothetical protein